MVERIRERARVGRFRGLDMTYGDLERAFEELSPLSRPFIAFELQEALVLESDLPLRPKYKLRGTEDSEAVEYPRCRPRSSGAKLSPDLQGPVHVVITFSIHG